ncbi:MAG: hypothetical protein ACRETA_04990 [Gammaproteobacteria bacterium]
MKRIVAVAVLFLAGCASTGVVQTGDNVYMISKESPGCGFASADSAMAEVYKEANAFCSEKGKAIKTVSAEAKHGSLS